MITPRQTRLIRVPDLAAYRDAIAALASSDSPLDARDRLIVVPTRAAAALLRASIERRQLASRGAMLLPEMVVSSDLPQRFAERVTPVVVQAPLEAREALMDVACRMAEEQGFQAPFQLRPGLVAGMVEFYDTLLRQRKDIAAFERLTLSRLEPGAEHDRGAERLVRQTRFLVASFKAFVGLQQQHDLRDEHDLRAAVVMTAAARPWRHAVVTVCDVARDPQGLWPADWDLLTRAPGLERLDVVVTEHTLAGAWHQQLHELLPGVEEVSVDAIPRAQPLLRVRADTRNAAHSHSRSEPARVHEVRDREEEVSEFARWVRGLRRSDPAIDLGQVALVVHTPLPYLNLAPEILRSANVPCRTFDRLPLAAEPYAAVIELLVEAVSTNFARSAAVALLSTPHLHWTVDGEAVSLPHIAAADTWLAERGYLGGLEHLRRIAEQSTEKGGSTKALLALTALVAAAEELAELRAEVPASAHLQTLLTFLDRRESVTTLDGDLRTRLLRGRIAVRAVLISLRDHYQRFDSQPVPFERVVAIVRRWIGSRTFAACERSSGVLLVDADSARFGDFTHVQLAGLVDGEWPSRPRRNVFYGPALLRDLGWSAEKERLDHARAAFVDLLTLPSQRLTVSAFQLEDEAMVGASPLVEEVAKAALECVDAGRENLRIFETEVLGLDPPVADGLSPRASAALARRLAKPPMSESRFHGSTGGPSFETYSLSALERYQDCPFKFFARDVLRLPELPEDEPFLSPRARGRFVHEVFQRFFEAWDAPGVRTLTTENLADARAVFSEVAERLLATLNESDAALERARLFGSAISVGMVDVVLGLEASKPETVVDRWLEWSFRGEYSLGDSQGARVPLRGIADRVDVLDQHRLRVIDYKTGHAPAPKLALQVPIYALCAKDRLEQENGAAFTVSDAFYLSFTGKRTVVPVVSGDPTDKAFAGARERVLAAVEGITGGEFPPRPRDVALCRSCEYADVCRKDYVHG